MLLGQKLAMIAASNGAKPMFRYLGKTTTYRDAYRYMNRFSYYLQNTIQHNKRVLVFMSNCPHQAYAMVALSNTKNLGVMADPSWPDDKIVEYIKKIKIEYILAADDSIGRIRDILRNASLQIPIDHCESRRWGEYEETYRLPPSISSSDKDPIALFETGGFGGESKFVPYSHLMLEGAVLNLRNGYRSHPGDVFFTYKGCFADSFFFIHGLIYPILTGSCIEIPGDADLNEMYKDLMDAKTSRLLLPPNMLAAFNEELKQSGRKLPLVRSITTRPGALLGEGTLKEFENAKWLEVYGTTESAWCVAMRSMEEDKSMETESVGQVPATVKYRLVDKNGDDLPEQTLSPGQILLSGPTTCSQYFNNPEATQVAFRASWFFTGDWVSFDKKRNLKFLCREQDICQKKGELVFPKSIEKTLKAFPGVANAAVAMVKNEVKKPQVTAVVEKVKGSDFTTEKLEKYMEEKISEKERPVQIAFLAEIPLDKQGWVHRAKTRKELGEDD